MLAVAARELDRAFQRCSSDLDVIASKLENEFENNPSFSRVSSASIIRVSKQHRDASNAFYVAGANSGFAFIVFEALTRDYVTCN
jgi:hypothetical protein